jgi:hypothetical protein
MGWAKGASERLRQQQEQQSADATERLQDRETISLSADTLWRELTETLEKDVQEFTATAHKAVDFRAYSVNPNHFVVERPTQPTLKFVFVHQPGVGFTVEVSGFSFNGMTGLTTELSAGPRTFRFGIDGAKRPCFVAAGKALSPAEISAQTGAQIEQFVAKYL